MIRTVLLLILCTCCLASYSQKADQKLLVGKWMTEAIIMNGVTYTMDSVSSSISRIIKNKREVRKEIVSPADSVALAADVKKNMLTMLTNTFMTFDDKGNCTFQMGIQDNPRDTFPLGRGNYKLKEGNILEEKIGEDLPMTYTIDKLTKDKLTLTFKENEEAMIMKFYKAH